MAALVLRNLSKLYPNGTVGVHSLDIEVSEGELMVLVGPSGSGKSTTLRLVAGLEEPTEGEVYIGGKHSNNAAPRDRDIAMVFQDYALYPHLNVSQNLGFGLKMRGVARERVRERVTEVARLLGISELLDRKPRELSGGQRQRVALGRALARNPKVFLFDEPLSNLDAALRVQLRNEIKHIHRALGATMLYVTHDQSEAMTIGERIAVMRGGRIEQVGTPAELYQRPDTEFVARFLGTPSMNMFEAQARGAETALEVSVGGKTVALRSRAANALAAGVLLGFRPEDVFLANAENHALAGTARVREVEAMGADSLIHLEDEGLQFLARTLGYLDVEAGSMVGYGVFADKLHLFDAESGKRVTLELSEKDIRRGNR